MGYLLDDREPLIQPMSVKLRLKNSVKDKFIDQLESIGSINFIRIPVNLSKKNFLFYLPKNTLINNLVDIKIKKTIKRLVVLFFKIRNRKIRFNLRNFLIKKNKFLSIGMVLSSLKLFLKKDKKSFKGKSLFIKFIIKRLFVNYMKFSTYIYFNQFDKQLFLILKKSRLFRNILINTIIININHSFYKFIGRKVRRIKKRIKKRMLKQEMKSNKFDVFSKIRDEQQVSKRRERGEKEFFNNLRKKNLSKFNK